MANARGSPALVLKLGREKSLLRRHPWVFSGAIERVEGQADPGETVAVRTSAGAFLAWAAFSPHSGIRARVWSWDEHDRIDAKFFRDRVRDAIAQRGDLARGAARLVHSEADQLPGVVCDRYADVAAFQFTTAGAERWRDTIIDAVMAESGCAAAYERSELEARTLEGLLPRSGWLRGEQREAAVSIVEHGLRYRVDLAHGQKTGFYLDQRANRKRVRALARGRDVLDCFCYTGGFSLNAFAGEARSLVSIDSSASALSLARENAQANGMTGEWVEADVFQALRTFRNEGRSFDLIILDPPKLAPTAGHAEKAARAYKDINLLALKLARKSALIVTFSCSGGISPGLFQSIVAGAAADAAAATQIRARLQADTDHPVMLAFPEGEYLKGLVLQKT
jgi:23S rRNA (cytosine1962-C5)-methyltransferase